ncbi:hypothetical protein Bca4012_072759 [Brassica carinata]
MATRSSKRSAEVAHSVGSLATALSNLNLQVFPQDGTILPSGEPLEVVQTISQLLHFREWLSIESSLVSQEELDDLKHQVSDEKAQRVAREMEIRDLKDKLKDVEREAEMSSADALNIGKKNQELEEAIETLRLEGDGRKWGKSHRSDLGRVGSRCHERRRTHGSWVLGFLGTFGPCNNQTWQVSYGWVSSGDPGVTWRVSDKLRTEEWPRINGIVQLVVPPSLFGMDTTAHHEEHVQEFYSGTKSQLVIFKYQDEHAERPLAKSQGTIPRRGKKLQLQHQNLKEHQHVYHVFAWEQGFSSILQVIHLQSGCKSFHAERKYILALPTRKFDGSGYELASYSKLNEELDTTAQLTNDLSDLQSLHSDLSGLRKSLAVKSCSNLNQTTKYRLSEGNRHVSKSAVDKFEYGNQTADKPSSIDTRRPSMHTSRSLRRDRARAKAWSLRSNRARILLGRYVVTELEPSSVAT